MVKIDTHAHWFPPEWIDLVAKEGGKNGAEVATDATGKITKFSAPASTARDSGRNTLKSRSG